VKHLTGANLKQLQSESQEQWDARIGAILRREIAKGNVATRYDAILIDEGQDFAFEWLQSLTDLLNEQSDSLLLCLDPAQNIFGRKVTFKSVGIKVQGKKPILLKKSYRNTAEILALARTFSKVSQTGEIDSDDSPDDVPLDSVLFPLDVDRHGDPPLIVKDKTPFDQIVFILDYIDQYIASGECSWCDIGVLYTTKFYDNFANNFAEAFTGRFGADKLYWISESHETKTALDVSSESVKLSTIESAKGMEFRVVFLVGLEILPRTEREEASERSLAYVGLTRAQDALFVLGKENKGFFSEIIQISQQQQLAGNPTNAAAKEDSKLAS
jgi:superfamily I DNA/RNA helicase